MNKNLAKIIALALTVSAFSAIAPKSMNKVNFLGAQEVQASSKGKYLKDLTVVNNKDKESDVYIKKSTTSSKYKVGKVDDGDVTLDLYAKVNDNTKKISIDDIDLKDGYYCKYSKSGSSDEYTSNNDGDDIKISGSSTTVKLKIYDTATNTLQETYSLKITKDDDNEDDEDDEYDDIYLDSLKIKCDSNTIDFDFSKKKTSFDVTVDNSVDHVKITAEPEDDDNDDLTVKVDGTEVDDDDDWESKKISLNVGLNTITIKLKDDEEDEERKYTLNITRKDKAAASTTTTTTTNNNTTANTNTSTNAATTAKNGWVKNGYAWNYYANGAMQRNQLFYDRTYGKTYYVDANGIMATGWKQIGSTWYYFGNDGAMRTGWVLSNGKWYFMDTNGKMLANTSISGYRLGANGAWIK